MVISGFKICESIEPLYQCMRYSLCEKLEAFFAYLAPQLRLEEGVSILNFVQTMRENDLTQ